MARRPARAPGPTASRHDRASGALAALACAPALAGCVAYEPAPVDLSAMLASLEAVAWEPPIDGAGPGQLASFAVAHHPALRAARAEVGVARALLVEAGLLADPEIGWDGMDALASQIVDDTASSVDFLSGFSLSIPLPRPGELDAREDAAGWRAEEARRRVLAAEWSLALDVYVACEDVLEAHELLEENERLVRVVETTRAYFERARSVGAATAIDANLARGDVLSIEARRVRLEGELAGARQRLNALLGLPPRADVPVVPATGADGELEAAADADALVERALARRPDLAASLAAYAAAEDDVRLAVARQLPLVSIGTGIAIVPGFFTRWGRPAIETAKARRAALQSELEARVHGVRSEVHAASLALESARREVAFLESELLPNAEESLRLAGDSFDAGEVTLLEILTLQRALVDARTRTTEARAELRRDRWRLLAASGALLGAGVMTETETETDR